MFYNKKNELNLKKKNYKTNFLSSVDLKRIVCLVNFLDKKQVFNYKYYVIIKKNKRV